MYLRGSRGVLKLTAENRANFSGLVTVVKFQESRLPTAAFLVGKLLCDRILFTSRGKLNSSMALKAL